MSRRTNAIEVMIKKYKHTDPALWKAVRFLCADSIALHSHRQSTALLKELHAFIVGSNLWFDDDFDQDEWIELNSVICTVLNRAERNFWRGVDK